jgi:hypothetical protein
MFEKISNQIHPFQWILNIVYCFFLFWNFVIYCHLMIFFSLQNLYYWFCFSILLYHSNKYMYMEVNDESISCSDKLMYTCVKSKVFEFTLWESNKKKSNFVPFFTYTTSVNSCFFHTYWCLIFSMVSNLINLD